ncbi:MAG: GntR family transcriptional regulator [Eubacteriales bacterium]|nr:GntR family transcriptional regulator [Eubacteriales bacterium]MDY3332768.1 GntR family transcriptional regulator [Gallibacter sp.]
MGASEQLYMSLKDSILSGNILTGEKLTEQILCKKYDISRTPVREALHKLETEGLLTSIPNRGFYVQGLTNQDYLDIFVLRELYEIQAVQWATERMNDEELEELEELFEFMEFYTYKKDLMKMLTINSNFHKKIYDGTHNRMLQNLLSSYQELVKYAGSSSEKPDDYLDKLFIEHKNIFMAIKERNPAKAGEAMREHIQASKSRYLNKKEE